MERGRIEICGEGLEPIYKALEAESRQPAPGKGRATVRLPGNCIVVEIEASDLSGLRAIVNSYLLLAAAARSALEAGGYYK